MPLSTSRILRHLIHNDDLSRGEDFRRPTTALPGTPEKEVVMVERVAHNLSPFHPEDATFEAASDLALEPPEDSGNGNCSTDCIDSPSGADPLQRRAARTDGRQTGDERQIRARLDARRAAQRKGEV